MNSPGSLPGNSFTVSTECPSCGAPLDFNEGANAVKCGHCGSSLLVTGRRQILSYHITHKIDKHRAILAAAKVLNEEGGGTGEMSGLGLYFIPYYRLTGHDFRWEKVMQKVEKEEDDDNHLAGLFSAREKDFSMLMITRAVLKNGKPIEGGGQVQLNDRYVEKNFEASDLRGSGVYSLGVRPSVMQLKLFRKEQLSPAGTVVGPDISPEDALSFGLKSGASSLLYRAVLGKMLSIVYFPFWIAAVKEGAVRKTFIIDAVTGSMVKADAGDGLVRLLDKERPGSEQRVAGFRPMVCPNCGWDLPVRPDDIIFFCSQCNKAWQIRGDCLYEVNYEIADLPVPPGQETRRLPFWVLDSVKDGSPFKYYIPAFRYRRLKYLADLAVNIIKKQPSYQVSGGQMPELVSGFFEGCCYDQEDAVQMARFIAAGADLKSGKKTVKGGPEFTNATLTWFPFKVNGAWLADPFAGFCLPSNLFA